METLNQVLREQEKIETIKVSKLKPIKENALNPYLEAILEIIIQDSIKHRFICLKLIEMLGQDELLIPEPLRESVTIQTFNESIEQESNTINKFKEMIKSSSPETKALLEYMVEEKIRDHGILKDLMELLSAGELRMEKYYQIADSLMKMAHQPAKPPRTQY
jgi:hypothetical protein